MELCQGNLAEYVSGVGWPSEQIPTKGTLDDRAIIGQIVCGLSHLHGKHIIHKDLKPENILLQWHQGSDCWLLKLTDFGFSRQLPADNKETTPNKTKHKGTDGYIAPELYARGLYSFESDVWSLGSVVFYVVSQGQHLYDIPGVNPTHNHRLKNKMAVVLQAVRPNIEEIKHDWAAVDLVYRLMMHDKERRPSIFLVLYHPFFSLTNTSTKRHLADKVCDLHDTTRFIESTLDLDRSLEKSQIIKHFEEFEKELRTVNDREEFDKILEMVGSSN